MCSLLEMVNSLHQLEALVICDTLQMNGDFGKLGSHPSLQTIKLVANLSTCEAFTSILKLWQLEELWIEELGAFTYPLKVVSSFPVFLTKGSKTTPR